MNVHQEDAYGNELTLDDKHCDENELRLVVNGQEFYLDTKKHGDVFVAIERKRPQIVLNIQPAQPTVAVVAVPVLAERWLR